MACIARFALVALLSFSTVVVAREVAGVNVPDRITLDGMPLVLNGAGIRTKFFVKVYVGALYLPAPQKDAAAVLAHNGAGAVRMHFLHGSVGRDKIVGGWNDGFAANLTDAERAALAERLARFNQIFPDMKRGEVVRLEFLPNVGTRVYLNDELRGTIEGADFFRALLKVWLGDRPADADLKQAMLGGNP
jgi:hypothetical protein